MLVNVLLIVLAVIAVALVGLVAIVAMQPSELRVSRSATITAPVSEVFAQVKDFRKWSAWSPYEQRDPAMKKTYEGAPQGTGAIYAWNGNQEVGEGRSTILECRENELIRIKLEFVRPFKGVSTAEFAFQAQGRDTVVTWSLMGKNNFMAKAVGLVINMDKMVGGDFEKGLAALKHVVETAGRERPLVPAGTTLQ